MEPATRKGSPGVEFSTARLSTVVGASLSSARPPKGETLPVLQIQRNSAVGETVPSAAPGTRLRLRARCSGYSAGRRSPLEPATRKGSQGSPGVEFSTALLSTVMGAKYEFRQASEGGNAARFPSTANTVLWRRPCLALRPARAFAFGPLGPLGGPARSASFFIWPRKRKGRTVILEYSCHFSREKKERKNNHSGL